MNSTSQARTSSLGCRWQAGSRYLKHSTYRLWRGLGHGIVCRFLLASDQSRDRVGMMKHESKVGKEKKKGATLED